MGNTVISARRKELSRVTKAEWREYTKSVWHIANTKHPKHPAVFPIEIPRRLIKLFSFYGETVLDPFAGVGSSAEAAIPLGRRIICVDQNPEYMNLLVESCRPLRNGQPASKLLTARRGDSRDLGFIGDESVDLIVTSPPYWNKAAYGEDRANLGNIGSYVEFLAEMRKVFAECHRVLAPGRKLCVVTANVNQFTDHGLLSFPLAADFVAILRELKFLMVSEIVWSKDGTGGRWGSWGRQRPIFGSYPFPPNFLFKTVHEYVLVFSKAATRRAKGARRLPYDLLMGHTPAPSTGNRESARAAKRVVVAERRRNAGPRGQRSA